MNGNIISWNFENFITVVLMVALVFGFFALVTKSVKSFQGGGS